MAKAGGASNAHLRVRLLEFALSVPLAALIVAVRPGPGPGPGPPPRGAGASGGAGE